MIGLGNYRLYCIFLACLGKTQTQISLNLKKVYKRQLFNPTSHNLGPTLTSIPVISCHVKEVSVYSALIFYTLGDVFDFLACLTDMRTRNSERPDLIFLYFVVYT